MKSQQPERNTRVRYVKYLFILLLVLISIKPLQFTWHLIRASHFFYTQPKQAEAQILAALSKRPAVYHTFKTYHRQQADRLLIKSLIKRGTIHPLKSAHLAPVDLNRIKKKYKNNLYIEHLFPGSWQPVRHPEHLDDFSLQLLADPSFNQLTEKAFAKHLASFSRAFLANVSSYCNWKGNTELGLLLEKEAVGKGWRKPVKRKERIPLDYGQSVRKLVRMLAKLYNITMTENQIVAGNAVKDPGISNEEKLVNYWVFNEMANIGNFGNGSYTLDYDAIGKNSLLRIMGFYTDRKTIKADSKGKRKRPASGGAWYRETMAISPGTYLFTFDYATFSANESASFFLGKFIKQPKLPHTRRKWNKVFFFLNNRDGQFKSLRPLFRMWGTGTFLVDNVALLKINSRHFRLKYRHAYLSIRMGAVQ
jgi:hypothetical protein